MTLQRFDTAGGVPIHYARDPVAPYGTRGKPHSVSARPAFRIKLDRCLEELWKKCGFGRAQVVVSAGAHVNKPGMHGLGRAIDIDSIFWPCKQFVTRQFLSFPVFYLAVESVLKKHFGTVLDYHYNAAHRDHFHVSGRPNIGFRKFRTHTLYVQSVCWYMLKDHFARTVAKAIDGKYGPKTDKALKRACAKFALSSSLTNVNNWNMFLDEAAALGFADAPITFCNYDHVAAAGVR